MQEKMGNISLNIRNKMLETKNNRKNAFDGFISRLDRVEERITELKDVSRDISNWKAKRRRMKETKQTI